MPIKEMIAIRNSNNTEAKLKLLMAMHCAPLMKGLVMANVLTISKGEAKGIRKLLKGTGISVRVLREVGDKVTLYLYRSKNLQKYLKAKGIRAFLKEYGYVECSLDELLGRLSDRIGLYSNGCIEFPHEIGIFLGYPLHDVKGFIENEGRNFVHLGYWKVYHNVQETIALFEQFDKERETAIREVVRGKSIWEIAV